MQPAYRYAVAVERVIDGDTVELRVDCGFRVWVETPVRLYGLDCPEHGTPAGDTATAFTAQWAAAGKTFVADTYRSPEKYGRWLADVYRDADPVSLNQALLAAGKAQPWSGHGPRPGSA